MLLRPGRAHSVLAQKTVTGQGWKESFMDASVHLRNRKKRCEVLKLLVNGFDMFVTSRHGP
jgi:hypothetical protein